MLWFLLIFISGCQLKYQSEIRYNLQAEFTWVESETIKSALDLNDLSFESVPPNYQFQFNSHQDLLIKITINELIYLPKDKEFILSIYSGLLNEIYYYQADQNNLQAEFVTSQGRISSKFNSFSNHHFDFNIDDSDLLKSHFLLIKSDMAYQADIELFDSSSYLRSGLNNIQLTTLIYSLIFAIGIFCILSYFTQRKKTLLIHSCFVLTSLLALLWQNTTINNLPWLVWPIIGPHSYLLYMFIAGVAGVSFLLTLYKLNFNHGWLVRGLLLLLMLQAAALTYATISHHMGQQLDFSFITKLLTGSYWVLSLCCLLLIFVLTNHKQSIKHFAAGWMLLLVAQSLNFYYTFNPDPSISWMTTIQSICILLAHVILVSAITNTPLKTHTTPVMPHERPRSQKGSNIFKQQLVNQFQSEMQKLAEDTTLSKEEIKEKTNIKFHLLLNRAYPIKNSLIMEKEQIHGICTTGIDLPDIDFLKQLALEVKPANPINSGCIQKLIGMAGEKQSNVLFIPLKQTSKHHVIFILILKNNETLKPDVLLEMQNFCDVAYDELNQAKEKCLMVFASKLDSLTQCYNRESIETIIKHSLDQKKLTTVAYIDLDHLKAIGEQQGVANANQLVADFAQHMRNNMATTAKIGRIGGDEFLAVFSGYDFNACLEQLESFNESLKGQGTADDETQLTCSIGIAESRMNETTRTLIKKAKTAMQHAKNQGGNQIALFEIDMKS
ncbi:MAG: diguanylate cyclase [Xanthomonadales bacterium]|nr:diguanylate cyclase [Xanthomonadales bacterium]